MRFIQSARISQTATGMGSDYLILDNEICGNLSDNTGDGKIDERCIRDDAPTIPTPPNGNTLGVELWTIVVIMIMMGMWMKAVV